VANRHEPKEAVDRPGDRCTSEAWKGTSPLCMARTALQAGKHGCYLDE